MTPSLCPECGAPIKTGATFCSACLLSAGAVTLPVQPVGAGITTLPCDFGDYRLLKKLGMGGMGIVYEAEQFSTGRRLALKVLNQRLDNEEQRQRFLREGRLAATIDHPNSVYVFGTEEIEGMPVIAMELATGGTLRDELKRRGTLPVRDAVDAILNIVDGLEAAHRKGVLHRDMKPTNCFVTGEGKAIVGDYGLSISQRVEAEHLTQSGVIMGTPAFSPPEQLRGQELDQRADIYSTAGTLYYLLTGKAPVESASSVATVAAVLEGRIPSVHSLRSEVPSDLSEAIAKCMSPQAAKRPATYAEMRALLLPFSSSSVEPAPLGLRWLAGLLDTSWSAVLFYVAVFSHPTRWDTSPIVCSTVWNLGPLLVTIAFLIQRFGSTPGLWLCCLRLQSLEGARPNWSRALLWSGLFCAATVACAWLVFVIQGDSDPGKAPEPVWLTLTVLFLSQLHLLLFLPALRRPDRAAWHDLASGVRAVRHRDPARRLLPTDALPQIKPIEGEMWGPFVPSTPISDDLRCGYDPVLRRRVLLKRATSTAMTDARRDCARGGRLRWLQRVTDSEGQPWDVWQALAGAPLTEVLQGATPTWSEMLFWLQDLGTELHTAEKDDTVPVQFSLSQVWITSDGRAVLLDEIWPGQPDGQVVADPQRFLHLVASQVPAESRPTHADPLVQGLESGAYDRLSHVSGNLTHLRQKRTSVSGMARAACVIGPMVVWVLLFAGMFLLVTALYQAGWDDAMPGQPPLPEVLKLDPQPGEPFQTDAAIRKQMRIHLAGHYRGFEAKETLAKTIERSTRHEMGKKLRQILAEEPEPTPDALADADQAVREAIKTLPTRGVFNDTNFKKTAAVLSLATIIIVSCVQLLCILFGSPPPLMRLTGMAIVATGQRPASRLRMLWRWVIGWCALWSVTLVILITVAVTHYDPIRKLPENAMLWVPVMLLLMVAGLPWPRRSLLDRLAGTWIVAR